MRKVRLTESDMNRLVKKVIQEQGAAIKALSSTLKTSGQPGSRPQSSGPRNITLSLDCGKKILGKLPMTTQQISTWCKTGNYVGTVTPQPNTQPSSPIRGGSM